MKKTLIGFIALLFVFTSVGCGQLNNSATKITKSFLAAKNQDKVITQKEATDGFDKNSQQIIFAVETNSASSSKLKIEWRQADSKKPIKTEEKTTNNQGKAAFELNKPATGWAKDKYNLTIFLNNQTAGTKDFTIKIDDKKSLLYDKKAEKQDSGKSVKDVKSEIKSNFEAKKIDIADKKNLQTPKSNPAQIASSKVAITTPQQAANATFLNGNMCLKLNADDSCLEKTDWYYDTTSLFSLSTEWKDLKPQDKIWAVWYWEGVNGKGEYLNSSAIEIPKDSSGFVSFGLQNTGKTWYSGSYWVEVYYNSNYFSTVPFAVYSTDFKPSSTYSQPGYYDSMGNYILYDGTGYYDQWGNFNTFGTDWNYDYPEDGHYDEFGNYILNDGTGFYDQYGNFVTWNEWYGPGHFNESGDYLLDDGSGYYDTYGNWWPNYSQNGQYDENGNYILVDGSGYYDNSGIFHPTDMSDPARIYGPGHNNEYGDWILDDGSGYYDSQGYFWPADNSYQGEDGYYDSCGNYVLYSGEGFFDLNNDLHDMSEYTAYNNCSQTDETPDYYDDYYTGNPSDPNATDYFDEGYWDDWYSEEAVG